MKNGLRDCYKCRLMAEYYMKVVAVDIGNSLINIGFFMEIGLAVQRIDTRPLMSPQEYATIINKFIREKNIDKTPEGVIISSVVPDHTELIVKAFNILNRKEPLIVTHKLKTGIDFQIKEPEKLGTDRLAASVGACDLFGAPLAVIDFGTATTVNFIGKGNVYKGGAIIPGIGLMKNALSDKTAQLPDTEISRPLSPLGKDTRENILSGIIYGTAGAVERIIEEVEDTKGVRFKIIVTGGYSGIIAPFLKRLDHVETTLVLKGLKSIYEKNTHA
ncbi:MAG: type III pantothenate kinase [Nitrospirae bacterium]|nr:type III pantothenate kinase [Nitrospirota bacterium]